MFELPRNKTAAAVYAKIKNNTDDMQRMSYVHSPIAEHIEVHRTIYHDGVTKMRRVKHLSLSPKEVKPLVPGGFHLMVFGIYDDLEPGSTFEITFEFESGHVITSLVEVRSRG